MLTRYLATALLCASLLAGGAIAQEEAATEQAQTETQTPQVQPVPETEESAPAEPNMPKAEPVLQHIPADAIGFVIVNDVGTMTAAVDNYLSEVGLAPLLAEKMPNGVLDAIKSALMLGEGFNPNGGFAAAMLPPDKYGVDLDKLMKRHGGEGAEEEPSGTPAEEPKLPLLILVPGAGVQEVFGNYEQTSVGKYTEVALRMGKMLATQVGGYVALSPRADVLDSLAAADTNVASKLSKEQAEFVDGSLIAFHVDFAGAAKTMETVFEKLQKDITARTERGARGKFVAPLGPMLLIQQLLVSQLDTVTAGLRLTETGLVCEYAVSWKPDSEIGKAIAAVTPPAAPPLNRLPNLPYVIAYGAGARGKPLGQAEQTFAFDMLDKMMSSGAFPKMDEEMLSALKELVSLTNEEVTEVQFVAGGAPEGSGLVALGCVVGCNNSARVKDAIVEKVPAMINRLIEKAAKEAEKEPREVEEQPVLQQPQDDPPQESAEANEPQATQEPAEVQPATEPSEAAPAPEAAETGPATAPAESKVKLVVSKAAESIDGVPVDVVEIVLSPNVQEQAGQQLATMFGEEKLRIFLVNPDDKTLVVTFGGAKEFLAEAIRTAKAADGDILATEGAVEAMRHMPRNTMALGLLNVGNLFELIGKIAAAMAPEQAQALPFQVTCRTPIAFGGSVSGATQHIVYYLPTELVKEVSGIVGALMGRGMRHPPEPAPSGQDF